LLRGGETEAAIVASKDDSERGEDTNRDARPEIRKVTYIKIREGSPSERMELGEVIPA